MEPQLTLLFAFLPSHACSTASTLGPVAGPSLGRRVWAWPWALGLDVGEG